jgi:hypothetical protein
MAPRPLHTFVYGPLRSGKTSLAATFPKPIFLSSGTEGGDTSLRFFDVDVIQINSLKDMKEAVAFIKANAAVRGWRTVVVDSVTYYADQVIQELTNSGEKPMNQRDWGMLDSHLQKWLLPTLRALPMHVVWIANEEPDKGDEGKIVGYRPMLYGKTSSKLPGACDLIVRSHVQTARTPNGQYAAQFFLRTIPIDGAPAGGRFGNAFADGMIVSHFGAIAERIGPYIGEAVPTKP